MYSATFRFTCLASRVAPPGRELGVEMLIDRTPEGITYTVMPAGDPDARVVISGTPAESVLVDRVLRCLGDLAPAADDRYLDSAQGPLAAD